LSICKTDNKRTKIAKSFDIQPLNPGKVLLKQLKHSPGAVLTIHSGDCRQPDLLRQCDASLEMPLEVGRFDQLPSQKLCAGYV
jgi:hypothetical protein